jgi:hypothetical protein
VMASAASRGDVVYTSDFEDLPPNLQSFLRCHIEAFAALERGFLLRARREPRCSDGAGFGNTKPFASSAGTG